MNNKKLYFFIAIFTIIIVVFTNINLDISVEYKDLFSNSNIISTIVELILVSLLLYINMKKTYSKRLKIIVIVISIIFSIFDVIGYSINNYYSLSAVIGTKIVVLKAIMKFIGNIMLFYNIIILLYDSFFSKIKIDLEPKANNKYFTNNILSFIICFLLIMLAYFPYFLELFPGILSVDSIAELSNSTQLYSNLMNHHPVFHILIIKILVIIIGGKIFDNYTIGIAIYSLLQMITVAFVFSYVIYYMAKKGINKYYRLLTLLFFAFFPPFALYSIAMWKDVMFAVSMILFIICLIELIIKNKDFYNSKKQIIMLYIAILLVVLFRNNGIYIVLMTIPFIIIFSKGGRKRSIIICASICITYVIIKGPIFSIFNIEDGQIREALSIPMQQMARVIKYRGEDLSQQDKDLIYKFIPTEELANLYNPTTSDPVKEKFDSEAFENNKIDFIKIWLKINVKFPKECIESFLSNCYGYWYPEAKNGIINIEFVQLKDLDDRYNISYERKNIIGTNISSNIQILINEYKVPIISTITSIGLIFWCFIMIIGYIIYTKRYKLILIYVPIVSLWITTIASPVFCEFRYVYSFYTCLPLLTFLTISLSNNLNEREVNKDNERVIKK